MPENFKSFVHEIFHFCVYDVETLILTPKAYLDRRSHSQMGFSLEQKVELIVSESRMIIQPFAGVRYDLDKLINGINASNIQISALARQLAMSLICVSNLCFRCGGSGMVRA
jgi:hypothetical protein